MEYMIVTTKVRGFQTAGAVSLLLAVAALPAAADQSNVSPDGLGAQWQEWALSIPTSVNPTIDATGNNCMVGQQGSIWFLAGFYFGGSATRTCSLPGDKFLFFPVINAVNINAPNVCG